jgi:hypothetical protein
VTDAMDMDHGPARPHGLAATGDDISVAAEAVTTRRYVAVTGLRRGPALGQPCMTLVDGRLSQTPAARSLDRSWTARGGRYITQSVGGGE